MKKLSEKPKDVYHREMYEWCKAHHICVTCGCENAVRGKTRCVACLERANELGRQSRALKYNTERNYRKKIREKRRRDLCIAFGVCIICRKRDVTNGFHTCSVCRARERIRDAARRRKAGIYPRDSYSGLCVRCGKNPPIDSKKLCSQCYSIALQNLSKAREKLNNNNHIWRADEAARIHGIIHNRAGGVF